MSDSPAEFVVLVDDDGTPIGTADKSVIHDGDTPLHLAFSCHVVGPDDRILITRRSSEKRTWPGVWSNACCGHPRPGETLRQAVTRHLRDELGLQPSPQVVGMMPGAEYGPAKCWPIERFAELAARLTRSGCQVWIFGSAKEQQVGARIAAAGGTGAVNLCGRTRLEDAVDLLALAPVAVTNDSGLMHVAAAVGKPVVAIFGPTREYETAPLPRAGGRTEVVLHSVWCRPCMLRECPIDHRCMTRITPAAVLEAADRLRAAS